MKETKKSRAVKLIESANAFADTGAKVITYDMLVDADFSPCWEYGDRYNDIAYIQQIARKMGYRTAVGTALHLFPKQMQALQEKTDGKQ